MNKRYEKGVQKRERVYLKLVDRKMIIAKLALQYNLIEEKIFDILKKQRQKKVSMDYHVTLHEAPNGHAHFPKVDYFFVFLHQFNNDILDFVKYLDYNFSKLSLFNGI